MLTRCTLGAGNLQHALMHDGVATRLADHQVGPLHDHDRDEEGRVAGELEHLALCVRLRYKQVRAKGG